MLYLSVDSGGTKTAAVLFDETMHVFSAKTAPFSLRNCGRTVAPPDELFNMFSSLFSAFAERPLAIEELFIVDGNKEFILALLPEGVSAKRITRLGESLSGLLAGKLSRTGFLTIAGTGSDAFYLKDGEVKLIVGSLGPIFGDEGAGTWIGRETLAAATHYRDGWGAETVLWHSVCEKFELDENGVSGQLIGVIYPSEQPYRILASLVPLAVSAAEAGDKIAKDIFCRAANLLAEQTAACIRRSEITDDKTVVLCGGIFKGYAPMVDLFTYALHRYYPDFTVEIPLFEHVVAGAVEVLLRQGTEDTETILKNNFSAFVRRMK